LLKRDKGNLDIFWLRDESLEDSANLPDPHLLASEIVEDLQAALEQFGLIEADLAVSYAVSEPEIMRQEDAKKSAELNEPRNRSTPMDELQKNVDAAQEQLRRDLKANDPKAQEFFRWCGKEINTARKAEGKPEIRADGTLGEASNP
jgi:hypothetical protein